MIELEHYGVSLDRLAIFLPLVVAFAITFCTVIIQALAMLSVVYFVRYELRLGRAGVRFYKDVAIVAGATLVALAAHLVAIAMWALVFSWCGEFSQLAGAIYHSAMSYTTLGGADTAMSASWRILAPLEGANGMLMFGVSTAMLFAVIQRLIQTRLGETSSYSRRAQPKRN